METIEFIYEGHIYLVDGIITPSVSEILRFIFPHKYSNIPRSILNQKAEFGSRIHKAIELYERKEEYELTALEQVVFNQYLKLKERHNIQVISQEEIVAYENEFCGRLDMTAWVDGIESLIDIKTTAQLHEDSLSWQLGMYQLAIGKEYEKCYCIWLPKKDIGRLVEVKPKSKAEILEVLKRFKEYKENASNSEF